MINEETIEFYNSRLTLDVSSLKSLSPAQKDKIRHYGSQSEALLKNKDLAMFVHHFKFELADRLAGIGGHTPDDNAQRIAISNELAGIDNFITGLKRAVYWKNRIGNTNEVPNT